MSSDFDTRLLDINALVMGNGVGLAALEAMFNLVNTQSALSTSMVKHHDLSHPANMRALAMTLSDILAATSGDVCGFEGQGSGYTPPVAVNFPANRAAHAGPRRSGGPGGHGGAPAAGESAYGSDDGSGGDPVRNDASGLYGSAGGGGGGAGGAGAQADQQPQTSNLSMESSTLNQGTQFSADQHMTELLALLREHLSDILKNSKPTLAVT